MITEICRQMIYGESTVEILIFNYYLFYFYAFYIVFIILKLEKKTVSSNFCVFLFINVGRKSRHSTKNSPAPNLHGINKWVILAN